MAESKEHTAGTHLVVGIATTTLNAEEQAFLRRVQPAGVILFSRNVTDLVQLQTLIREIRRHAGNGVTLWIDQEGGRVQRLRHPLTRYPSPYRYAERDHIAPAEAEAASYAAGWLCGRELFSLGIGVDCAPVLDVREEGANPVIGERAFGSEPQQVIRLAGAWLAGLTEAGVMGVGKHFPGHGAARVDSHQGLPVVEKSREALEKRELIPFRGLLDRLPALMTAHLVATGVDPVEPATLSEPWLHGILRQEWGYSGLIVSDALEMRALAGSQEERARRAFLAGCDLVLCCTGVLADGEAVLSGLVQALEFMPLARRVAASERIHRILPSYALAQTGSIDALWMDPLYQRRRAWVESLADGLSAPDPTESVSMEKSGSPG